MLLVYERLVPMDELHTRKRGDGYRTFAGTPKAFWMRRGHNDLLRTFMEFMSWCARILGLGVIIVLILGCTCISVLLLWPAPN